MRLFARTAVAMLMVAALPGLLFAQGEPSVTIEEDNEQFGGSAAEFLLLGAGARGMALGGAYASIADDVNALYYNPAGLTRMDGVEMGFTMMPYFADTDYWWAGLAFPFSDNDFGFGVYLGRFGFGDSPVYTAEDPDNLSELTFGVNEVVAGLSFAHAFIDKFSGGVTVKFIMDDLATQSLGGASASTVAFDIGTSYHTQAAGRPLNLSFVIQNLGGELKHSGDALRISEFPDEPNTPDQRVDPPPEEILATGFPLPRTLRIGAAYDVVSMETTRLSLMADFVEANQAPTSFGFAAEFGWMSSEAPIGASLRGSWYYQPDNEDLGAQFAVDGSKQDLDGFNVGGGLFYRIAERYQVGFDYAYRHFGLLGSVDVFSFSFGYY